jgi:hypothetical protein
VLKPIGLLIATFFLLLQLDGFGQNNSLDEHSKRAPFSVRKSPKKLAKYLVKPAASDSEKVRAFHTWITNNIKYDYKALLNYKQKDQSAKKTLKRGKAVCEGYANLMNALCEAQKIRSHRVQGYDKGILYRDRKQFYIDGHAWNAVEINNQWRLLDLSWSCGYVEPKKMKFRKFLWEKFKTPYLQKYYFKTDPSYDYFFTPPQDFVIDHLPSDPAWQLISDTLGRGVFELKPHEINAWRNDSVQARPRFNYRTAIEDYLSRDEAESALEFGRRGKKFNQLNSRVYANGHLKYVELTLKQYLLTEAADETNIEGAIFDFDTLLTFLDTVKVYNALASKTEKDFHKKENNWSRGRYKTIKNNNRKRITKNKSQFKKNKRHRDQLASKNDRLNAEIRKLRDRNRLLRRSLRRNRMKDAKPIKPEKQRIMERNRKRIAANFLKIKKLTTGREVITNRLIVRRENTIHETLGRISGLRGVNDSLLEEQLEARMEYDYKQDSLLEANYSTFNTNNKDIDSMLVLFREEVKVVSKAEERKMREVDKEVYKLLRENVKLFAVNQKISPATTQEDSLYEDEVRKLIDWNIQRMEWNMDKVDWNAELRDWLNYDNSDLSNEAALLRREYTVEQKRFKKSFKREHARHAAELKVYHNFRVRRANAGNTVKQQIRLLKEEEREREKEANES